MDVPVSVPVNSTTSRPTNTHLTCSCLLRSSSHDLQTYIFVTGVNLLLSQNLTENHFNFMNDFHIRYWPLAVIDSNC